MAKGSRRSGYPIAILAMMAALVAALAWSTVLVARSLRELAANALAAAMAPLLEGIATAIHGMILREIATAIIVLVNQGGFRTLAWIGMRMMAWQGF